MHKDTIDRLPDDYMALGARRHTMRYNDYDFQVEVTARPESRTTNEYAKKRAALNIEANIRKSAAGLGMGQYLAPEDVETLRNGRVVLSTMVNGRSYSIPVEVSPDGEYSCKVLRSRFNSLKDVCAKVMDGIFEYNGIDNMYRSAAGMRGVIAAQQAARAPAYGSMRM